MYGRCRAPTRRIMPGLDDTYLLDRVEILPVIIDGLHWSATGMGCPESSRRELAFTVSFGMLPSPCYTRVWRNIHSRSRRRGHQSTNHQTRSRAFALASVFLPVTPGINSWPQGRTYCVLCAGCTVHVKWELHCLCKVDEIGDRLVKVQILQSLRRLHLKRA